MKETRRNEEPRSSAARYLIVRSYYFHIRSLTPQQAARNARAIRFTMKFHTTLLVIVLLGFASLSSADENPRCIEVYDVEVARIVHDAGRDAAANPPGPDIEVQQQFMMPVEQALKAAADRARLCEEKSRAETSAAANLREKECIDKADQQITTLLQRNAGRSNLSRSEQRVLRDEENRIGEARADCLREAR
jgi:hypothetical protein